GDRQRHHRPPFSGGPLGPETAARAGRRESRCAGRVDHYRDNADRAAAPELTIGCGPDRSRAAPEHGKSAPAALHTAELPASRPPGCGLRSPAVKWTRPFPIRGTPMQDADGDATTKPDSTLDATGLLCPLPVLKARLALKAVPPGGILEVLATD